jgi:hypothetical protein
MIAPALAAMVIAGITVLLLEVILIAIIAAFATDLATIKALVMPLTTAVPVAALVTPFVAIAALFMLVAVNTAVPSMLTTLIALKVSRALVVRTPPDAVRSGTHTRGHMVS